MKSELAEKMLPEQHGGMHIPKVNVLEEYDGQDAQNWLTAHTLTGGTLFNNPELLVDPIQFHSDLELGRVAFHIPDRLDKLFDRARKSTISFQKVNLRDMVLFEWPEDRKYRFQLTLGFKSGAEVTIYFNSKWKVAVVHTEVDHTPDE